MIKNSRKIAIILFTSLAVILSIFAYAQTAGVSHPASEITAGIFGGDANSIYGFSGKVGIGIAAPGQKLSVGGIVESTTGGFKFPDGTIQTSAAAGLSNNINGDLIVSGKVGIGTTTPQDKLQIGDGSISSLFISIVGAQATGKFGTEANGISIISDTADKSISFFTKASGDSINKKRMVITKDGRVGIGTDSPANDLSVIGSKGIAWTDGSITWRLGRWTNDAAQSNWVYFTTGSGGVYQNLAVGDLWVADDLTVKGDKLEVSSVFTCDIGNLVGQDAKECKSDFLTSEWEVCFLTKSGNHGSEAGWFRCEVTQDVNVDGNGVWSLTTTGEPYGECKMRCIG